MKRIGMVGDGKVALDCLRILHAHPNAHVALVLFHEDQQGAARMRSFCERTTVPAASVRNVNEVHVLDMIREAELDIFFSIGSADILKSGLLRIPNEGVINFHNGPLPGLRGVNVPAWAILKGNAEHAVTWHIVDEGIDTGPIVAQRRFPIDVNETAISLIFKCVQEGVALFEDILDDLLEGAWEGSSQVGDSEYFSKKDLPHGGFLDTTWSFDQVSRFVRGLDFRPFPNPMTHAKIRAGSGAFVVTSVSREEAREAYHPGEVVRIEPDGLVIGLGDSLAKFGGLADLNGVESTVSEVVDQLGVLEGSTVGR